MKDKGTKLESGRLAQVEGGGIVVEGLERKRPIQEIYKTDMIGFY